MISYIDTREVENVSNELLPLIDKLEAEFNALFERFSKVTTVTKEWIGGQAEFYFSRVALDKKVYTELIAELRQIASELDSEAESANSYIKANNTES